MPRIDLLSRRAPGLRAPARRAARVAAAAGLVVLAAAGDRVLHQGQRRPGDRTVHGRGAAALGSR